MSCWDVVHMSTGEGGEDVLHGHCEDGIVNMSHWVSPPFIVDWAKKNPQGGCRGGAFLFFPVEHFQISAPKRKPTVRPLLRNHSLIALLLPAITVSISLLLGDFHICHCNSLSRMALIFANSGSEMSL